MHLNTVFRSGHPPRCITSSVDDPLPRDEVSGRIIYIDKGAPKQFVLSLLLLSEVATWRKFLFNDGLPAKQWYCSALQSDGQASFANADSPDAFKDILATSVVAWVDFRTDDYQSDVESAPKRLGFSDALMNSFSTGPRNLYEDLTTELGIKLPSIQIRLDQDPIVLEHTTLVLMREGLILTIHPVEADRRYARLRRYFLPVLTKISSAPNRADKLTLLLMRIIETNNDRNFEHLREIEEHGDTLNKSLMDPRTSSNSPGSRRYTT